MNSNLSAWAISNRSLVYFLMILSVAAGTWSYIRLGRSEDPSYTWRRMVVEAYWPGATVDETLQQVTDRLEKTLQEVPYVDYLRSYTIAGRSIIFVALKGSTPSKSVPDSWYQVRKKINDIRETLPTGVIGPKFNDEFDDTFGIIYAFTANGFTHRELRDYVENARSTLLRLPDVSKVEMFGVQDERIYLEFSWRRLADLNIHRTALIRALQAQNAINPAGTVQTSDEQLLVRLSGHFASEDDLRRVNFAFNGRLYRLVDLATVKRSYADPPQPLFRTNGEAAVGLGIAMREGGNILALGSNVQNAMNSIMRDMPIGIEAHLVANQPEVVSHAFNDFIQALWEAVAIVMAVSLLSLGLRAGTVVAVSIPLVLAVVFVVMSATNIGFQRVSLGALIIALGLLVDDAMITVESMVTKLEEGWDKVRAATYAYANTHFPMGTGTLVTVAGFLPIGMARSVAGEYTFSLFAVVAIALIVSWFVAATFAPLIGVELLTEKKRGSHHTTSSRLTRMFRAALVLAMRRRWFTVGVTLGLFGLSVYGMQLVPRQFFPASDRPELMVDLTLRQNASIYATDSAASQLDGLIKQDPDVDHWSTYIGSGAVHFYLPHAPELANTFFAQAVVVTKGLEARERVRTRLQKALQERLPGVLARVYPLELGVGGGWPLQYRIRGPEPNVLRDLAYRLAQVMAENVHVQDINFDWIEPEKTIQIKVDQDQARTLGISSETLAQSLQAMISGITITQLRDGIHLIDVVARGEEHERLSPEVLGSMQVPLIDGNTVPLIQIAKIGYGQELPFVRRYDRLPSLTVQSDIVGDVQPDTVVKALRPKIAALSRVLPSGYSVDVAGDVEQSAKSQESVAAVVPLMLVIMLTILMVQLRSFQRLLLVLSVAPLGLIGVVAALLITHKALGFVALLGVIALIGMIVRNSVILVVQIDREIVAGKPAWDAVVEATTNRFRPILLTAAAAILGMIPIAPTVFWSPMALAIMGGLAIATVLTLLFLPALYVIWFRVKVPTGSSEITSVGPEFAGSGHLTVRDNPARSKPADRIGSECAQH